MVAKGLSVRQTEQLVRSLNNPKSPKVSPSNTRLQQDVIAQLTEILSTKVTVSENAKGKGKIVINYNNEDELTAIIRQITH